MELAFAHPEFEYEVRSCLKVFDRPITEEDAVQITELDLSNFNFHPEDHKTLCHFKKLTSLGINIGGTTKQFWRNFPDITHLYLCTWGDWVDFGLFKSMKNLESLCVSGGDLSGIDYVNLDALVELRHLQSLELHEFGSVDLSPLSHVSFLREFALRYADKVINVDTIGSMHNLDELVLDGLTLDSLDFLELLPDSIRLEMCGIHVNNGVDVGKWKRFNRRDICEISVMDKPYEYIDLSVLND